MGRGFGALDLPESLRALHGCGLRFVLRPPLGAEAASPDRLPAEPADAPQPSAAAPDLSPAPAASDAASRRASRTWTSRSIVHQDDPAETAWPAPWDLYLARAAAPSRTVWTYLELGRDMLAGTAGATDMGAGPEVQARRGLFRNIIQNMAWPKGSVAFWPLAAEGDPEPELFWRGVDHLQAEAVVVFGRGGLAALCPGMDYRHSSLILHNLPVHVLPGPEDMLPDNKDAKRIAWTMLKAVLAER
jgi:hypothetical protein